MLHGDRAVVGAYHVEAGVVEQDRAQAEPAVAVEHAMRFALLENPGPDGSRTRGPALRVGRISKVRLPEGAPEPLPAPDYVPILALIHRYHALLSGTISRYERAYPAEGAGNRKRGRGVTPSSGRRSRPGRRRS